MSTQLASSAPRDDNLEVPVGAGEHDSLGGQGSEHHSGSAFRGSGASGSDGSPQPAAPVVSEAASTVAASLQFVITHPQYQPQERILNMDVDAKRAFMQQYQITRFQDKPVKDDPVYFLKEYLQKAPGVRVGFFPVPKHSFTTGPGGDVPISDTSSGKGKRDDKSNIPISGAPAPAAPLKDEKQEVVLGPISPYGTNSTPPTVHTTNNFVVHATSVVRRMEVHDSLGDNPWDNALLTKDKVTSGEILFANISQLPSSDNKIGKSTPKKPCMHLMIFCPLSHSPIAIVERYLSAKKERSLRVFNPTSNGTMEAFGNIMCIQAILSNKIRLIITGPDNEERIYIIKTKKSAYFLGSSDHEFLILKGKTKVGLITPKFFLEDKDEKVGATTTDTSTSLLPASYDLFFPAAATWPERVMLMVATLYIDYFQEK